MKKHILCFLLAFACFGALRAQCPTSVTDGSGNSYTVVRMGTQCWTATNMRTTLYADGETVAPAGVEFTSDMYSVIPVETNGLLYTAAAAMRNYDGTAPMVQGICPDGWHIPSQAEMNLLLSSYDVRALMSEEQWLPIGGNNSSNFGLLPSGFYNGESAAFEDYRVSSILWTTEPGSMVYHPCRFGAACGTWEYIPGSATGAYSVRCVRDIAVPCTPTSSTHNIEITTDELPYAFGDTTFLAGTATGTYTLHRTNAGGCDSTITVNLTVITFTCGTSTISDVDGNTYSTVQIGEQCWMKENLRTTKKPNGSTISSGIWEPGSNSVDTYGRLYSWTTVMNGATSSNANPSNVQGICPTGWHVPSDAEWIQMEMEVGISQSDADNTGWRGNIAAKLCGNTGWNSSTTANAAGNLSAPDRNSTGFSALPAGYYNGSYTNFGSNAAFLSATEYSSDVAYYRRLYCDYAGVWRSNANKTSGYSVRCVRGMAEPCAPTSSTHNIEITTDELPYSFGDTTFLAGTATGTYTLHRTNAGGCDSTITVNLTVITFTCGTSTISDVDGNTYNTVQIGTQCWMKENLRTTKKPDGTTISSGIWAPGSNSVDTYGRLYSWTTVMNGAPSSNATPSGVQGICPDGWHVPSDAEWIQMEMEVGMSQSDADNTGWRGNIAAKLCGNTGWSSSTTANAAGNLSAPDRNSTGFSALPAGYYTSSYSDFGNYALFWSATEYSSTNAYGHRLGYSNAGVYRYRDNKTRGYSVRCVRD